MRSNCASCSTAQTDFGFVVPKVKLVSRLQTLSHSGDLRIPTVLPDAKVLTRELQEFRVKTPMRATRRSTRAKVSTMTWYRPL